MGEVFGHDYGKCVGFQISVHMTDISSNSVEMAGLIFYQHLYVQLGGWSDKVAPKLS